MSSHEVDELVGRARRLAGLTIADLARRVERELDERARRNKGIVGLLVERALGATASSRPIPDFESIGVELKTLPVGRDGAPLESTFVCNVTKDELETSWEESHVRRKLAHVLFVPIEGDRAIALDARRVGTAFVFELGARHEEVLGRDYENLRDALWSAGRDAVPGHLGVALQVRPKGKNARDAERRHASDGVAELVAKRAFYLRATFTRRLLEESGLAPPSEVLGQDPGARRKRP